MLARRQAIKVNKANGDEEHAHTKREGVHVIDLVRFVVVKLVEQPPGEPGDRPLPAMLRLYKP